MALPQRDVVLVGSQRAIRFVLDAIDVQDRVRVLLLTDPPSTHLPHLFGLPTRRLGAVQPGANDLVLFCSPCALAWTPHELRDPGTRHERLFPETLRAA